MPADAPPMAPPEEAPAQVIALNDEAALYTVLAVRIRGRAAGWSPSAVHMLEAGLRQRFQAALGPQADAAIGRLMALACDQPAA